MHRHLPSSPALPGAQTPLGLWVKPSGTLPGVLLQTHPLHLVFPESTFYLLLNDLPKAQIQSCLPWWGLTPAELSTRDLA